MPTLDNTVRSVFACCQKWIFVKPRKQKNHILWHISSTAHFRFRNKNNKKKDKVASNQMHDGWFRPAIMLQNSCPVPATFCSMFLQSRRIYLTLLQWRPMPMRKLSGLISLWMKFFVCTYSILLIIWKGGKSL